jgi:hypothetical protein
MDTPGRAVRCFLLEPTDRAERELRRHARSAGASCPATGFPYHHAARAIEDGPVTQAPAGAVAAGEWPHDGARWPRSCACGYRFAPEDEWQVFVTRLWRNPRTGEEYPLRDAPVGAMWYADWTGPKGPDGHALAVMTPAGPWLVERPTADGVFYVRHGAPPDVTVEQPVVVHAPVPFRGWLQDGVLAAA